MPKKSSTTPDLHEILQEIRLPTGRRVSDTEKRAREINAALDAIAKGAGEQAKWLRKHTDVYLPKWKEEDYPGMIALAITGNLYYATYFPQGKETPHA